MTTAEHARLRLGLSPVPPEFVAQMRRERQVAGSTPMQAANDARLADYYARRAGRASCQLQMWRAL